MDDLKLIKKHYGDNMMHLCRDLFPTILETEGLLWKLISSEFAYNKSLYDDLVSNNLEEKFKNFIFDKIHVEKKEIISNLINNIIISMNCDTCILIS